MIQEITVDLQRPPQDRWRLTPQQIAQARELIALYTADLGLRPDVRAFLTDTARDLIEPQHWAEIESLCRVLELPMADVVASNFYYDAMKISLDRFFGCTGFAVETPTGILHARNLDWWTENAALARCTALCHFTGGAAGPFKTVGWPGFTGAFSGIAQGRFAVTLNAVLSRDPAQLATPVVLLLRNVLERAPSYEAALQLLAESPIPCDCLLLLTGVRPGELAVIERTPGRHAIRHAQNGFLCVTNGYQKLQTAFSAAPSELLGSWCQRLQRAEALVGAKRPANAQDCFEYLTDPEIRMRMTVQQMVFHAATGEHWVRFPPSIKL